MQILRIQECDENETLGYVIVPDGVSAQAVQQQLHDPELTVISEGVAGSATTEAEAAAYIRERWGWKPQASLLPQESNPE